MSRLRLFFLALLTVLTACASVPPGDGRAGDELPVSGNDGDPGDHPSSPGGDGIGDASDNDAMGEGSGDGDVPADMDCPAPGLRVLLVFNDTAIDPDSAPRRDALALLEIMRMQSRTRVAMVAAGLAVRRSGWFDVARDDSWSSIELDGLLGSAEADDQFDLQGALSAARDMVQAALAAEVPGCATTPYVVVVIGRYLPGPTCSAGAVDQNPVFPDGIDGVCEDADYRACLMAAGRCEDGSYCDDARGVSCQAGDACAEPTCGADPANGGAFVCSSADGTMSCFASIHHDHVLGGLVSPALVEDGDYNQTDQIVEQAQDILELFIMKGGVSLDAVVVRSSPEPLPATIYGAIALIFDGTFLTHESDTAVDWTALGFSTSGFVRPAP